MTKPNEPIHPDKLNQHNGLSKREWMAAMAMQGMLSNSHGAMTEGSSRTFLPDSISRLALLHADALINALNEKV